MDAAETTSLLLHIALRHRPKAADVTEGLALFEQIAGRPIPEPTFRAALAQALADGLIYDPVRIAPGALQCHWQLEVTPAGAAKVSESAATKPA
jgi:hypothetical protein